MLDWHARQITQRKGCHWRPFFFSDVDAIARLDPLSRELLLGSVGTKQAHGQNYPLWVILLT